MAYASFWMNDSEPDANGDIIAQIRDDQSGRVMSTFKGKSIQAVANQILQSSAQASEEIGRMRRERQPDQSPSRPVKVDPRPLSADDQFRISQNLMDPSKSTEAITEVVTRTVGAPPDVIGNAVREITASQQRDRILAECAAFVQANPAYVECKPNEDKLIAGLANKGWDVTRHNLELVYDELSEQGLLIQNPDADVSEQQPQSMQQQSGARPGPNPPSEPNPPRPSTRPRHVVSTGIRTVDASGARPNPSSQRPKYTRESIARMSKDEYRASMRDPAFVAAVDGLSKRA